MARSDFGEAVRLLLVKNRLHVREHCTLTELESYRQGTLSPDRQEVVADHLAVCEDCTILLLYALAGPDDGKPRDELLEQEIDEAWERLRPHLESRAPRGRSLDGLIGDQRLPPGDALPLALEISRALALLHSSGRAHPDLRAENVLVTPAGEVRLLERGFAPTPESLEVGYGRSAEAVVADLYPSLSPEQLAGEEPDQRSNLFSLGVLIYELLTGVSPFRAETPLQTASRILSLEPAPAKELNSAVPSAVSNLLERLLAKEPADRPPGAGAVVRELESAIDLLRPMSMSGYRAAQVGEIEAAGEGHGTSQPQPPAEISNPEDQIEYLYDEIIALVEEQATGGRPDDGEIERRYARLRELQAAAARDFRTRFEASLAMPIDAGQKILDRAHALREELEDLAARDAAARHADTP